MNDTLKIAYRNSLKMKQFDFTYVKVNSLYRNRIS